MSSHATIVVRKQCASCPYIMRHVDKRVRWCKVCRAGRLAERINRPEVRAKMAATHFETECRMLGKVIDTELAQPTRYWESY
jgi:hypothetical protein